MRNASTTSALSSLAQKRSGYYLLLLRQEAREEQQQLHEQERLKLKAFDQLRNRFHDETSETLFRVIQTSELVELTFMDGKRGYFFCRIDSDSEGINSETKLDQYIKKQNNLSERSIDLKIVDYKTGIAGFFWEQKHG